MGGKSFLQEVSETMTPMMMANSNLPFKDLKYIKMNLIVIKIWLGRLSDYNRNGFKRPTVILDIQK